MVHEGTAASERLAWMTETHVKPFFDAIRPAWQMLRDAGVAAPIESEILYYVLVGAASLPYVNAPEVRLLTGRDPRSPEWIEAHADGLVAILLPGVCVGATLTEPARQVVFDALLAELLARQTPPDTGSRLGEFGAALLSLLPPIRRISPASPQLWVAPGKGAG